MSEISVTSCTIIIFIKKKSCMILKMESTISLIKSHRVRDKHERKYYNEKVVKNTINSTDNESDI